MEGIACPETSVTNYLSKLRKISEEQNPDLFYKKVFLKRDVRNSWSSVWQSSVICGFKVFNPLFCTTHIYQIHIPAVPEI
jgi:hypothetical protein